MRSVGWALTWEYWRKRRWYIIFLSLMWIMLGYISGLRIQYAEKSYLQIKEYYQNLKIEDPDDYKWAKKQLEENISEYKSSVNEIYHSFLFYLIFPLGCIMIGDTKKNKIRLPERLFTLPISTHSLVARIFLYEIISIMILSFVYTGFFVFFTGKTVSIFGISLFSTTAIITIQSFLWLAISAPIIGIPLLLVMSFGLFLWFAAQHQFLFFSGMDIIWEQLEPDQAIFMFFCMLLSYIVAVKAVSLDRVKENLSISEMNELLDHKIRSFFTIGRKKFKSATITQFWFEWQRHGFLMPFIILFFMLEFIVLFSVATAPAASISDIFNIYFFVILIFLSLFWGMLIAKTNPTKTDFDLWPFEATRPLSSRDISFAILKNGVVNIFLCGVILIFSVILGMALNYFLGNGALIGNLGKVTIELDMLNLEIKGIRGLIFILFGMLVISWILMAISSVLTLTGSRFIWGLFWMISFPILFIFYLINAVSFALPKEIFFPFLGRVLILEIAFLFFMAKRRNFIEKKDILRNLALWAIGSVILILISYTDEIKFLNLATFASGIMALALAPFALAPLALHWNRHR